MTIISDPAVVTAVSGDTVTRAFWDVAAGGVQLVAIIRAVRLRSSEWPHGRWSKVAAVVVAGWLTISFGVLAVPVGAVAVIWYTRTLVRRRPQSGQVPDLPMAEGHAESEDGAR